MPDCRRFGGDCARGWPHAGEARPLESPNAAGPRNQRGRGGCRLGASRAGGDRAGLPGQVAGRMTAQGLQSLRGRKRASDRDFRSGPRRCGFVEVRRRAQARGCPSHAAATKTPTPLEKQHGPLFESPVGLPVRDLTTDPPQCRIARDYTGKCAQCQEIRGRLLVGCLGRLTL